MREMRMIARDETDGDGGEKGALLHGMKRTGTVLLASPGMKRTGTVLSFHHSLQLQGPSPPFHAIAKGFFVDEKRFE